MTKILIVEDSDAVALGLRYGLEREGFEVMRAENSAESRPLAPDADLIILDIRLPDGSGFDLCRMFRAEGLHMPILMLTARDEMIDKILGLELGADDYMTKPFELRELIARIRSLLRRSYGDYAGQTPVLTFRDLVVDLSSQRATLRGEEVRLTNTEFKILSYLAQHPNKPHNRDTLIDDIWGYDTFVGDPRTVDVHIRNLRQKIETDASQPEYVVTIRGAGYMLDA
ncbi:MAG: response regulator transcription factor [Candidatus Promineifilaceae bacterium]